MEIEPGVHQIPDVRQMANGLPGPNAFLVVGEHSAVFLDTGYRDAEQHRLRMDYLEQTDVPLTHAIALHRHPDHAGGAGLIAAETGATISCHEADREGVDESMGGDAKVDRTIAEQDELSLGGLTLQVLHTPGHTEGCLSVYVPERKLLFASDTVMQVSTTAIGEQGNLARYLATLHRLTSLDVETIHCGHGPPVTRPKERLLELIKHREEREAELLALLRSGPYDVPRLREGIYPELGQGRRKQMAEAMIRSGLRKLLEEGRAREVTDGVFEAAGR